MDFERDEARPLNFRRPIHVPLLVVVFGLLVALPIVAGYVVYTKFRIDVPAKHFAVLTTKTGEDLENDEEVAPDANHKGLQLEVLSEGRYFYNPYFWSWEVYPMIEIPREKMGVRIRLYGADLPYGDFRPLRIDLQFRMTKELCHGCTSDSPRLTLDRTLRRTLTRHT